MDVDFSIIYHKFVVKEDIPKLSTKDKERISSAILEKLSVKPEIFGKPLRRQLKGYRKLRVGDYRIIFRIEKKTVKIFYIGHRSVAYRQTFSRMP
mgnify:CR=1 FL=1